MNEMLELTQEQKEEFDELYSNVTTNGGKVFTEDAQDILDEIIDKIIDEPDYPHLSDLLLAGNSTDTFNTQLLLLQALKDPSIIMITTVYKVPVPHARGYYYSVNGDKLKVSSNVVYMSMEQIYQFHLDDLTWEEVEL